MHGPPPRPPQPAPPLSDGAIVTGIRRGEEAAFESLMRQHNGRLFRVARAILGDDSEAEDALQDAYLDAFRHIDGFRGDARLGTWLTRIVANHCLMRRRRQKRDGVILPFHRQPGEPGREEDPVPDRSAEPADDLLARARLRRLLESRIDELPASFRTVLVMRDVEDMTVQETAEALGIPPATVRTRLFRARALLRASLARDVGTATRDVYAFAGARCDRIVAHVLARLAAGAPGAPLA